MEDARRVAVTDASPCIALARIGYLWLLPQLFDDVLVPQSVFLELIAGAFPDAAWSIVNHGGVSIVPAQLLAMQVPSGLSHADREVMALAMERRPQAVIVDDRTASRLGAQLGLKVVGTLGVIALARRRELIDAARPLFMELLRNRFRARRDLVDGLLRDLGEQPLGSC